jgi:hypothetical protein
MSDYRLPQTVACRFFCFLFHLNTNIKEGNKTTRLNPAGILPNLPFSWSEKEYLPK